MRILVVDVETTGVEPTDRIVELGMYELWDGTVYDVGPPMLFNPGIPIPPTMSAIHHIVDADVERAPSWPGRTKEALLASNRDAFAAHNAKFERQWLTDDLTGGKPWICTYRCALRVWPDAPSHSNQSLRYWLKPPGLSREVAALSHRAGPDAYVTAYLLRELLLHATFDELVTWSASPALLPRITFGKHKGKAWTEAPRDYLEWICRQADMSEDVKFTAQHYLKGAKP